MSAHNNDPRLENIQMQIDRLVSDRVSDKAVYRDIHKDHEKRIRQLELHYAKASGILIAVSALIQVILHFITP